VEVMDAAKIMGAAKVKEAEATVEVVEVECLSTKEIRKW
jgi:hypothetical protein